jgi:hypothetical protein
MMYGTEMTSGVMTYVPSSMTIGSDINITVIPAKVLKALMLVPLI